MLPGALAHDGAEVVADCGTASASCRLAYATNSGLTGPTYTSAVAADSNGYVRLPVAGLAANTRYHYGIEVAGVLDAARGSFKTAPAAPGVACSFVVAHASCTSYYTDNPSNHRVYDSILARQPLEFFMLGDADYSDIATANSASMRASLAASLGSARAKAMWANVPMTYVWDDHDFGPDNSDGTFVGKTNRAAVYRQMFPHGTLPDAGAIYEAKTHGRVRFIKTDNRYYRSPNADTDNSSKTMLGATQKAWLKAELLAAKDNPLTVWLNSQVWSVPSSGWGGIDTDGDHWGAFSTERAEINDYMATNGITNVIQLTGDQHALAYRETVDYSTAQTAPMRIYSAAALDALPVSRAGGWDQIQTGKGQYGTLTVADDGNVLEVDWEGWQTDPTTGVETLIMSDSFTVGTAPAPGDRHPVKTWDGAAWVERPVLVHSGGDWVERPIKTPA